MSRTLLVLRPQPGAAATACRATALGFTAIAAPLFVVAPVAWDPPADAFDAVMLTSANAVRHAGPALARFAALPAFAVGAATAAAARAAGFAAVIAGEADGAAIAAAASAAGHRRVLHLAGRAHRPLAASSLTLDLMVTTRIVYAATAIADLPAPAMGALAVGAVALIHSPRAAVLFRTLAARAGLSPAAIALAAISPAVLHAAGPGWRIAAAATAPNDAALLAAAARLCDQDGGRDG